MFNMVDTALSYERELIVCSFLQDFSTGKGSSLQLICNAHTAFLLCGADIAQKVILFNHKTSKEEGRESGEKGAHGVPTGAGARTWDLPLDRKESPVAQTVNQ